MANDGNYVYQGFVARGFPPVQAAILAGNMKQESGFNPAAYNPDEDAFGGFQWRADRKANLEHYAGTTGRKPDDIDAQMDFVVQEMLGNYGTEAPKAAAFLAATDPQTANAAIKKYIRWGDDSDGARLQNAMAYMGGQPQQAAAPALDAIAQATQGSGNMLTGDAGGFVNPAWGSSPFQMPGTVQAQPTAPAQPVVPTLAPTAVPVAPVTPPALSDDDLLGQFLPPQPVTAAPVVPGVVPAAPNAAPAPTAAAPAPGSDDDLLSQWAAPAQPAATAAPQAPPTEFAPGVVGGDVMAPGAPEPKPTDTGYQPSMVPFLDPISAFANAAVDAIPFVGPKLTEMGRGFDAGLNNLLTGQSQTGEDRAAINAAQREEFPAQSMAGSVAGTVAPFVAAGATPLGARLLGMSGSVPSRVVAGGLSSALISGGDTLARGGSVEEAGRNALIGGTIGGAFPAVGAAVNKFLAPAVSPKIAALAQMARDQFGITIGPGQISTNPTIRFLDSVVNKIPLTGGTASREAQQAAFNQAVSRTFGENADAITADVLENASTRIGQMFDDVAAKTPAIKADAAFDQQMLDAMATAQQTLTDAEMVPLTKQFDSLVGKFQQGGNAIDGETYQALTRKGTPLDLAMHSPNPNIRSVAGDFRDALDGALERSAAPDVLASLRDARSQWKALKTVQRLAEKGPIGDVSPALLQGAVATSYKGMPSVGAGGDLANLARIGQQFLKAPPSSGTAERLAIMNMLTKGGGAAAGLGGLALNPGLIIPAAVSAAGTVGAGATVAAILRSKTLANALIGNGLKGTAAARNALMAPAVPAMVGTGQLPHQPLRITVEGATVRQ